MNGTNGFAAHARLALVGLVPLVIVGSPTSALAAEWHVAPDGSPAGDGSEMAPWDLATATVAGDLGVMPGDTIWIHAGTYGTGGNMPFDFLLYGTEADPIIVRAYPGERATIDGGITVSGEWMWLWGLEITNSGEQRSVTSEAGAADARLGGVNLYGRGDRAINLVVHDTGHPAIGFWAGPGDGAEVYGCIIWGNGIYDPDFDGAVRGNGTYAQNEIGDRWIVDNISFRNWTEGLDAHSAGVSFVNGMHFEGNIVFDNPGGQITANTIDPANPMQRLHVVDNVTYRRADDNAKLTALFGYYNDVFHEDITLTGNYFVIGSDDDRAVHIKLWETGDITGNTFVSSRYFAWWWNGVPGEALTWNDNEYFGGNDAPFVLGPSSSLDNGESFNTFELWKQMTGFDENSTLTPGKPTGLRVFVRPNRYEPERAHVAVYNWDMLPTVELDLSDYLSIGSAYELIDAQNYYGGPIVSGVYAGEPVSVPMDLTAVSSIVGEYSHWQDVHTAPEFAAFVLVADAPLSGDDGGGSDGADVTGGSAEADDSASASASATEPGGSADTAATDTPATSSSATAASDDADDTSGCGCRSAGSPSGAALVVFVALARRRPRRGRASGSARVVSSASRNDRSRDPP